MSLKDNFSEIAEYYKNKTIFITGATGFIGKVLIEKLLRSCTQLNTIYVLVRTKKGHSAKQRLNEILHSKLFEKLLNDNNELRHKIVAIQGDLVEPNLGISIEDEKLLIENVQIVFHSAATVRFDEPLKLAVEMNIKGVKKMIDLAKKLKKLEAFVHVSTAYANCDRQHVTEIVYNPPISPEKIIEATDWMEDDLINLLTPKIIQFRPNTYTYTKAIAECLVMEAEKEIPIAIVRPSIVGAAWREPFPGWIDNYNGPTALFVAAGKGMLRTMYGNRNAISDVVPVDTPVNLMIAAAWYRGSNKTDETIVYNCTTGLTNPLRWGQVEQLINCLSIKIPLEYGFLIPRVALTSSRFIKHFKIILLQVLPSYLMDLYLRLVNRKPHFVRIQKKLINAVDTLEYFTTHQWEFTNDNLLMLKSKLNTTDTKLFNFDVKELHWPTYIEQYYIGAKKYVLKEDLSKMNKCRKQMQMLKRVYNLAKVLVLFTFVKMMFLRNYSTRQLFNFIFNFLFKFFKRTILKRNSNRLK